MAILKSKSGASYDTKSGKKTSSTGVVSYQNPNTPGRTSDSKGGSSKGIESNALVFDTPAYNAQFGGLSGEKQAAAIRNYSSKNPEMQKQATAFASSFYKPSEAIDAPIVADYSNMRPPAFAAADYTPVNQTSDAFVNSLTAPAQMQTSYDTQVAEAEAAAKKEQGALTKMTEKFNISDQYAKLQKQQGIPQMQKQLQEANIQLAQMQSQYQLQNQSLAQQTIPEPFVIGQQNELQKTAAITIGAQASYVQALQGNLELANHYVDKMTELQYQDFQVKYENQKYNLEIAQNYLTKAEAKQAKAMDFQLDMYKMNYSSFLDNKNQIWKNALSQGASSSELQSIARSQSDNDLAWAGQKYGMSAMEKADMANTYSAISERTAGTTGGNYKQNQYVAAGYGVRAEEADKTIANLQNFATKPEGVLTKYFPNLFKTSDRQKLEQAERNFINAQLRKESGAVISDEEFASARKQYIPQPGDSSDVLIQKSQNRKTVMEALKSEAGGAFDEVKAASTVEADITDEQATALDKYLDQIGYNK